MALYEVLADGTIVPKAGNNVGNLDCLRTEVVYDMTSSDDNKNWGYTSGIQGGVTVSGKNFSKYQILIISVKLDADVGVNGFFELTLQTPNYSGEYIGTYITPSESDSGSNYRVRIVINSEKTELNVEFLGYSAKDGTVNNRNGYVNYFIYKVEGVLKTPAMIYTGKELFAGNGISIDDGIISQTIIPKARYIGSVSGGRSFTGTSYSTVQTATVTTKGGRLFITASPQVHVNKNMLFLDICVDGTQYAEVYSNRQSMGTITVSAITGELSAGVHTVLLRARGQQAGNTVSFPSYNNGMFVIMEV